MADNLISGDDGTAPDYYLVIDFEATCCDKGTIPPEDAEIIEIGAVIADGKRLRPVDEFVRFVRPSRNPQLTAFCSELTSIHQADIDGARTLAEVLPEFSDWVSGYERYLFCSWGDFDHHHLQLERSEQFQDRVLITPPSAAAARTVPHRGGFR